jgi:hypothetical protein
MSSSTTNSASPQLINGTSSNEDHHNDIPLTAAEERALEEKRELEYKRLQQTVPLLAPQEHATQVS